MGFRDDNLLINGFSEEEAINYVKKVFPDENESNVRALVNLAGIDENSNSVNSLILTHICTTLKEQNGLSVSKFMQDFRDIKSNEGDLEPLMLRLVTLNLSYFQQIRNKRFSLPSVLHWDLLKSDCSRFPSPEEKILFLMSFFGNANIPYDLLKAAYTHQESPVSWLTYFSLAGKKSDLEIGFDGAVKNLLKLRLISRNKDGNIDMHPWFHKLFGIHFSPAHPKQQIRQPAEQAVSIPWWAWLPSAPIPQSNDVYNSLVAEMIKGMREQPNFSKSLHGHGQFLRNKLPKKECDELVSNLCRWIDVDHYTTLLVYQLMDVPLMSLLKIEHDVAKSEGNSEVVQTLLDRRMECLSDVPVAFMLYDDYFSLGFDLLLAGRSEEGQYYLDKVMGNVSSMSQFHRLLSSQACASIFTQVFKSDDAIARSSLDMQEKLLSFDMLDTDIINSNMLFCGFAALGDCFARMGDAAKCKQWSDPAFQFALGSPTISITLAEHLIQINHLLDVEEGGYSSNFLLSKVELDKDIITTEKRKFLELKKFVQDRWPTRRK